MLARLDLPTPAVPRMTIRGQGNLRDNVTPTLDKTVTHSLQFSTPGAQLLQWLLLALHSSSSSARPVQSSRLTTTSRWTTLRGSLMLLSCFLL